MSHACEEGRKRRQKYCFFFRNRLLNLIHEFCLNWKLEEYLPNYINRRK